MKVKHRVSTTTKLDNRVEKKACGTTGPDVRVQHARIQHERIHDEYKRNEYKRNEYNM